MNRIILIGNGFDLAHGLKTKYEHFIKDFWKKEIEKSYNLKNLKSEISPDGKAYYIFQDDFVVVKLEDHIDIDSDDAVDVFRRNVIQFKNSFLRIIEKEIFDKKWCDIENLYYKELIRCLNLKKTENDDYSIKKLNDDFELIRKEFEKYLTNEIESLDNTPLPDIQNHLAKKYKYKKGDSEIEEDYSHTLFLNFNYTDTERLYSKPNDIVIHIHGELNKGNMIFGYGDELDDDYKEIEKQENKEFQENLKFISYLKTKNYEDLLDFMNEDDYEIYIFGHSCGNSDRTLLNFLFEEGCLKECKKIRIFYHDDGIKTNYNDIIKDISKQFNKKSKLRELVTKESPLKTKTKPTKELREELEDDMIDVEFDNNSSAYKAIVDEISSKKDLTTSFRISKYQVTQDLWQSIMGNNLSRFQTDKKNPVECVSWNDIKKEFLKKLNKKTGKNYRLPTEAEWEYAARGGKKSKNHQYAGCDEKRELKFYAWYDENSDEETHPVGQLKPNELGLYDMCGNVWEWCEDKCDWKDGKIVSNPTSGALRVLRGGGWDNYAESCSVSYRDYYAPVNRNFGVGFRLVLPRK